MILSGREITKRVGGDITITPHPLPRACQREQIQPHAGKGAPGIRRHRPGHEEGEHDNYISGKHQNKGV